MKKILLIVLVLIAGCAKEPIDLKTLERKNGVAYTKDTNEPYTGAVFTLYSSGEKKREGYLKDGEFDGKYTWYLKSGQIYEEGNYKDGEVDGKWTSYNKDGSIDRVEQWKDGELVK